MRRSVRAALFGVGALLVVPFHAHTSRAELFQFSFTGEVTSVENPSGYLTAPVTVGAPVSGSFSYTDPPIDGSEEFTPFVTFYFHDRAVSPVTELVLRVGGVETRSSALSLTNMAVGNDNADPMPPFFPAGDFFRYVDELDGGSPLFDFSAASLPQFPFGNIILADSTGTAWTSQDVPHDLPFAAFDQPRGNIMIFDENSELTGRLGFRIDSIQAIPEPRTVVLSLLWSVF
jgi:hypothetical protein